MSTMTNAGFTIRFPSGKDHSGLPRFCVHSDEFPPFLCMESACDNFSIFSPNDRSAQTPHFRPAWHGSAVSSKDLGTTRGFYLRGPSFRRNLHFHRPDRFPAHGIEVLQAGAGGGVPLGRREPVPADRLAEVLRNAPADLVHPPQHHLV